MKLFDVELPTFLWAQMALEALALVAALGGLIMLWAMVG